MLAVDDLIKELDGLITSITSSQSLHKASDNRRIGIIGLDISIMVSPLNLPEDTQRGITPQYRPTSIEPLIDVIEDSETIRIIAVLSGIRKEDVHYMVKENFLEIKIFDERIYRKRIPLSVEPEHVSVKSTTINNSVLEIVFAKS